MNQKFWWVNEKIQEETGKQENGNERQLIQHRFFHFVFKIQIQGQHGECAFIFCAYSTRPVFLEQSNSSSLVENAPLCAISTRVLCVVVVHHVGIAAVGLRALWHLSRHRHPNHFQPALLKVLTFSNEAVDGLGLREAEDGRRVCGPGAVIHTIAQEGDSTLGLHVLGRVVGDEENVYLYGS